MEMVQGFCLLPVLEDVEGDTRSKAGPSVPVHTEPGGLLKPKLPLLLQITSHASSAHLVSYKVDNPTRLVPCLSFLLSQLQVVGQGGSLLGGVISGGAPLPTSQGLDLGFPFNMPPLGHITGLLYPLRGSLAGLCLGSPLSLAGQL